MLIGIEPMKPIDPFGALLFVLVLAVSLGIADRIAG